MCLLIVKPAGRTIPHKVIVNGTNRNPDGTGIVTWNQIEGLVCERKVVWDPDDAADYLDSHRDSLAMVHFRWATHGSASIANVHPFPVRDGWIAHNGVINGYGNEKRDVSDTRDYVARYLQRLAYRELRATRPLIERDVGWNKLASIHNNGRVLVFNRELWTRLDGVLYSNGDGFRAGK